MLILEPKEEKRTEPCPAWAKDVCMCGDYVDAHNMGSGHSPVSQWDYYNCECEE